MKLVCNRMSRTGRMSLERLEKAAPEFYRRYGAEIEAIAASRVSA